jgi:hypothetical protein
MEPTPTPGPDFTLSFTVPQPPRHVFESILRVDEWWIGEVEGAFNRVGAVFTYQYRPYHRTVQEVVELAPDRRVAWKVLEADITFVADKEEWKGTTVVFDIVARDGVTEVVFTHVGLTPRIECFENCAAGWRHYIEKSLPALITTGRGIDPQF